jgi:hypothetical protein
MRPSSEFAMLLMADPTASVMRRCVVMPGSLPDNDHVLGLLAFVAATNLVLDLLTFRQVAPSFADLTNAGEVDKHVATCLGHTLGSDEPVSLAFVEPLDDTVLELFLRSGLHLGSNLPDVI